MTKPRSKQRDLIAIAETALRNERRPIHANEFCVGIAGEEPLMTKREASRLYRVMLADSRAEKGRFVKVGGGFFDLRDVNPDGSSARVEAWFETLARARM